MGNRKVRAIHRVAIYAINSDPASAAEAEKLAKLWYDAHKEDHARGVKILMRPPDDNTSAVPRDVRGSGRTHRTDIVGL